MHMAIAASAEAHNVVKLVHFGLRLGTTSTHTGFHVGDSGKLGLRWNAPSELLGVAPVASWAKVALGRLSCAERPTLDGCSQTSDNASYICKSMMSASNRCVGCFWFVELLLTSRTGAFLCECTSSRTRATQACRRGCALRTWI